MMISLSLLTMTFFFSKVTIHSLSHNFTIDIILDCRLVNISACLAWFDKCCSGVWAWYVNAIMDELGVFMFIGFSYVSLVWTILVRESR